MVPKPDTSPHAGPKGWGWTPQTPPTEDAPGRPEKPQAGSNVSRRPPLGPALQPACAMRPVPSSARNGRLEAVMTSGGARARSGPAPDPDSFRQAGKDGFITLPNTYTGPVPDFPLTSPTTRELELWDRLWGQGHAYMWIANSQEIDVALHCRVTASIEASEGEPTAALLGVRIRMGEDLGLTVGGAKKNGWLFAKPDTAAAFAEQNSETSKLVGNVTDLFSGVKVRGA